MSTLDGTAAGFGANEWMVEEMRDAWLADPSSVTPQWRTLFEGSGASEPSEDAADPAGSTTTPDPRAAAGTTEAPRTGTATPPHRQPPAVQDVTRSDLPPAPPSDAAPPTSPYARRTEHRRTGAPEDGSGRDADSRMRGAAARTAAIGYGRRR